MYEIKCQKCQTSITEFSVSHDQVSFRTDYKVMGGRIVREDREYFSGNVVKLMFVCPICGQVTTEIDKCPSNSELRKSIDSDMINIDGDFINAGYVNFGILKS